jgi:predicted RNase H-like HicB family nuclease
VIEKAASNYAAYVPDLPGCISTGATIAEVEQGIPKMTELHIPGLHEDGQPLPLPSSAVEYVDIAGLKGRDKAQTDLASGSATAATGRMKGRPNDGRRSGRP